MSISARILLRDIEVVTEKLAATSENLERAEGKALATFHAANPQYQQACEEAAAVKKALLEELNNTHTITLLVDVGKRWSPTGMHGWNIGDPVRVDGPYEWGGLLITGSGGTTAADLDELYFEPKREQEIEDGK